MVDCGSVIMWWKCLLAVVLVSLDCMLVSSDGVTGTSPPTGTCLCVSASVLNVRGSACGSVIGQVSQSQCFQYSGSKRTCSLGSSTYEFFRINYGSSGGWAAGNYLVVRDSSRCSSGSTSNGCPNIVSRSEWRARAPRSTSAIRHPIPRVVIHHTEGQSCTTQSTCSSIMRSIQNYHMDSRNWNDIGYNFLIGEDGNVYEGRGWDHVGAHAVNYNSVSLGISVMGSFMSSTPNYQAQNAISQLIACGVSMGKLSSTYSVHGHRDVGSTDCPGNSFYNNVVRHMPRYGG